MVHIFVWSTSLVFLSDAGEYQNSTWFEVALNLSFLKSSISLNHAVFFHEKKRQTVKIQCN